MKGTITPWYSIPRIQINGYPVGWYCKVRSLQDVGYDNARYGISFQHWPLLQTLDLNPARMVEVNLLVLVV